MSLKIVQAGDPVLRNKARALTRDEIRSAETQTLIEQMREMMRAAPGVGLAAPQVGVCLRIAVIEDRAEYHAKMTQQQLAERGRWPMPFHVLINPMILSDGSETVEHFEGCLSVEGYTAVVPRLRTLAVEFLDHSGQEQRVEAEGWYARILQHEIDHLNGTLYIDRMIPRTFCNLDNYERLWKSTSARQAREQLG